MVLGSVVSGPSRVLWVSGPVFGSVHHVARLLQRALDSWQEPAFFGLVFFFAKNQKIPPLPE